MTEHWLAEINNDTLQKQFSRSSSIFVSVEMQRGASVEFGNGSHEKTGNLQRKAEANANPLRYPSEYALRLYQQDACAQVPKVADETFFNLMEN